ncbi:hypothetical protein SAMN04488042_102299 [Shimia aestuarii]|uniref:Uncharacterized protein n=2 Tax=Shimia aestuarii TaxID=254406 RepID=A0A1I4LZ63_9RHOB|nr:hypothetical protein SAMN04488042_102299 [Shimia aestuarii]
MFWLGVFGWTAARLGAYAEAFKGDWFEMALKQIIAGAVFSVAAGAVVAQGFGIGFGAVARLQVNPLPGKGNFEVIEGPSTGPQRFWCEAGNYAVRLGAGATDRMYILYPLGKARSQKNRYGVGFTINPTKEVLAQANRPGDGGNYSVSVKRVGYNLSIGHARGFCNLGVTY